MEANDAVLDAEYLTKALSKRRGPIKPALMDQKVIAGLGNIYAAEALWRAKISRVRGLIYLNPDSLDS